MSSLKEQFSYLFIIAVQIVNVEHSDYGTKGLGFYPGRDI